MTEEELQHELAKLQGSLEAAALLQSIAAQNSDELSPSAREQLLEIALRYLQELLAVAPTAYDALAGQIALIKRYHNG